MFVANAIVIYACFLPVRISDLQSGQTTDARDKAGLRLVFDGYELSLNKDQNMLPKTACAMVGRVHKAVQQK